MYMSIPRLTCDFSLVIQARETNSQEEFDDLDNQTSGGQRDVHAEDDLAGVDVSGLGEELHVAELEK